MSGLHFITKAQFQAVYDHFKQVEEDTYASREELHIEYRLLLGYFQSLYKENERKGNKIMQLTAEMKKCKEKSEAMEKQKEKEVEDLKLKLSEMNRSLEHHRKEEVVLVRLIDELKENINKLKATNIAKKSKSDTYINRRPTDPPRKRTNFREIAVGSSKSLQSSRSIIHEKNTKKEEIERISMPKEIEFMKRKYEDEIERLQHQTKVISVEAKLLHSEAVSLQKRIESKDKRFSEYKQQLSKEKELEKQEKENLQIKNSSLQMLIDTLVNDLKILKDEKRLLKDDIKNAMEERHALLLQIQEKNMYIEKLKSNLDASIKSKEIVIKRADMFEKNLTMDRDQLGTAKKDVDVLSQTINKLRTDLTERETQLNQQESQRKRLEASQKSEMLEQTKLIEYYKNQVANRDKRIKSLTIDLEQTNEKLASCRRQLRNKKRENAILSEEFQNWKRSLGINTENMKSLKMKLDSAETSKSELQNELKFTKSQYFSVLKERNKLLAQCKKLDSVIEYHEMENDLLNNRQGYLQNDLKRKDAQIKKIAKLRRLVWTKQ
ncbi:DNA ligase 1-like [Argiope bruennichi]|nr:DNA ligase 1-like [Argiope bruennichi]